LTVIVQLSRMPGESSVQPVSALHVGDNLHTDVGGAASVGMATVWIKGFSSSKLPVTENPDFTVTSILELPEVVQE